MARQFGDPTAYFAGRITLNPIKHIDAIGSIFIPGLLFVSGSSMLFGWAKPIPVNMANMSTGQKIRVAGAGIFTNLILAMIGVGLFWGTQGWVTEAAPTWLLAICVGCFLLFPINLILALYNLLPIPPLDGWVIFNEIFGLNHWAMRWIQHPAVMICGFIVAAMIMRVSITPIMGFVSRVVHASLPVM